MVVKEIRFGPQTDDHDYNFKLKHAQNFLKEGAKVKAYVFFRGRSIVFKEQGEILLLRFATDLEEVAKVEMMPKLDGKKMNMMLAPKSRSKVLAAAGHRRAEFITIRNRSPEKAPVMDFLFHRRAGQHGEAGEEAAARDGSEG